MVNQSYHLFVSEVLFGFNLDFDISQQHSIIKVGYQQCSDR